MAKLGRDNVVTVCQGTFRFLDRVFAEFISGIFTKAPKVEINILQVLNELHVLKEYLAPTLFLLETQDSHICDHPGIACLQFLNSCNIMQC